MKPFYREKNGSCMVLSVDDDPINQMVVESLLVPDGYKVEQAMNGSEALEFLSNSDTLPDVILLDIMMPDMSGYEVWGCVGWGGEGRSEEAIGGLGGRRV